MADEQNVIVPGNRFHFREPFFHPLDSILERPRGNGKDFFKQRVTQLPVGVNQYHSFSGFPRSHEVTLHIADPLFRVDNLRSFVNGSFVFDSRMRLAPMSPFPCEFLAVSFDFSSVRTCDICSDSHSGHIRQVCMAFSYPFGGQFGGLVVQEILFHRLSEIRVQSDCVRTSAGILLFYIRMVVGVNRVVSPSFSRAFADFIRQRAFRNANIF